MTTRLWRLAWLSAQLLLGCVVLSFAQDTGGNIGDVPALA
jgi:hypothetical protein